VDSLHALGDILGAARSLPRAAGAAQTTSAAQAHAPWLARHRPAWPAAGADGRLTVAALSALLARELGPDAVLFDEGVSHSDDVRRGTRSARPGSYFGQGGGSLGWGGGAALGYKLMRPEAEVAWITGDGSFVFAAPTSLYLTAQRYAAPFLTVILNNGGWRAVRVATDHMYGPAGHAARAGEYHHRIEGNEHLEQVAAAFGCHVAAVRDPDAFVAAVREARKQIAQGRAAVINAHVVEA
jgi:acetolactate synthase-1/2/3 large subunit